MTNFLLQIQDSVPSHPFDNATWAIVEPIGALIATVLVIVITFYMSNLKHDMLDAWLEDKQHRMKRRGPYARLLRFFFQREVLRIY